MPSSAPSTPNGTPNNTANGTDQLSYWAASTRKTSTSPSANTKAASPLDARSWNDWPEYDTPSPAEANWLAIRSSTWCSNSPVLWPALGVPVNCADVNPLNLGTTVGALRKLIVVTAETGTIVLFAPRTYSLPMSAGV